MNQNLNQTEPLTQTGTGGLGLAPAKCNKDTPAGEERASTLKVFENICEEHRYVHYLGKEHFSERVKWDNALETKHDWSRSILGYEEDLFQFRRTNDARAHTYTATH